MLYPGHEWGEFYPSAEVQLVYFAAPANWITVPLYLFQCLYILKSYTWDKFSIQVTKFAWSLVWWVWNVLHFQNPVFCQKHFVKKSFETGFIMFSNLLLTHIDIIILLHKLISCACLHWLQLTRQCYILSPNSANHFTQQSIYLLTVTQKTSISVHWCRHVGGDWDN